MSQELIAQDREAVEGFAFFLSVAGKPSDRDAPHRQLARDWYDGLLTVDEAKRIRGGCTCDCWWCVYDGHCSKCPLSR